MTDLARSCRVLCHAAFSLPCISPGLSHPLAPHMPAGRGRESGGGGGGGEGEGEGEGVGKRKGEMERGRGRGKEGEREGGGGRNLGQSWNTGRQPMAHTPYTTMFMTCHVQTCTYYFKTEEAYS